MTHARTRKLIAVDCDGTLFDDTAYPSQQTLTVIQRVVDAGHQIVAATGRSKITAAERLVNVPGMTHLICSNGAYAWNVHENQASWQAHIARQQVADIVSRLRTTLPDVSFGWETPTGIDYEERFVELAGGLSELESGGDADALGSEDLYKLYVRRPGTYRLDLQRQLSAALGTTPCEITTSGAPFVEITASGVHKASGLEKTARQLGFTAADTIVFGDNHNDLTMFRWAGHAVAMGNALEVVKVEAHAVTLSNTDHGVAHYLDALLVAGTL